MRLSQTVSTVVIIASAATACKKSAENDSKTLAIFGKDDRQAVSSSEGYLKDIVGYLRSSRSSEPFCTAYFINKDTIKTAKHCTEYQIESTLFVTANGARYQVKEMVNSWPLADVVELRVTQLSPANNKAVKASNPCEAESVDGLKVGSFDPSKPVTVYSWDSVKKFVKNSNAPVTPYRDGLLKHKLDTLAGASGSPMLQGCKVVAIHLGAIYKEGKASDPSSNDLNFESDLFEANVAMELTRLNNENSVLQDFSKQYKPEGCWIVWKGMKSHIKCDSAGVMPTANGAPAEASGELGRLLYSAGAEVMASAALNRSLASVPLTDLEKQALRPNFGDLVDRVRIYWDAKMLTDIVNKNIRAELASILNYEQASAQTFGLKIYIKRSRAEFASDYARLHQLAHELDHSYQYENYGSSLSNFGYHYFKGYAKGGNYGSNPMETEAEGYADAKIDEIYARYKEAAGGLAVTNPNRGNTCARSFKIINEANMKISYVLSGQAAELNPGYQQIWNVTSCDTTMSFDGSTKPGLQERKIDLSVGEEFFLSRDKTTEEIKLYKRK